MKPEEGPHVKREDGLRLKPEKGLHVKREVPAYEVVFTHETQHRYALVIPVINEGARLIGLLQRMQHIGTEQCVDILIVDGGSTDGSLELSQLKALGVHTLLVKTGPGKLGAQLRCAYAYLLKLGYAGIITIDGNGKDEPGAIAQFVEKLEAGYDFVQASRFIQGGHGINTPIMRLIAIRLIHAPLLSLCSGFHWTDTTQGFRGYSRKLLEDPKVGVFRHVFSGYELLFYLSYIAPRLGYRCLELPTIRSYPKGEVPTKISVIKGNLQIMVTLLKVVCGCFNVKRAD